MPIIIPKNTSSLIRNLIARSIQSQRNEFSSQFFYKLDEVTNCQLNELKLDLYTTSVVFGSFNQNDEIFSSINSIKFGHYCALIAYVYAILIPVADAWNTRKIDEIMMSANKLMMQDRTTEFILSINLGALCYYHIVINQSDSLITGTLNSTQNIVLNIIQGLSMFFQNYDAGLVICDDMHLMIWRHLNKGFFVFDAFGRTAKLKRNHVYGLSCLIEMKTLREVSALILLSSSFASDAHYSIQEINISQAEHVSDEMADYINQKLDGVIEDVYVIDDVDDFVINIPVKQSNSAIVNTSVDNVSNLSKSNIDENIFNGKEVVNVLFENVLNQVTSNEIEEARELAEKHKQIDMGYAKDIVCEILNNVVDFSENIYIFKLACFCGNDICNSCDMKHSDCNNYVMLPNKTAVLFSSSTKKLPSNNDALYNLISAIVVSHKHRDIRLWDVRVLDYIIKISYEIQSNMFPVDHYNIDEIRQISFHISLGLESFGYNAIYFETIYRGDLYHFLQRIFNQKDNQYLFISKKYSFIIFKQNNHYYLFDGFKYNSFGLIQRDNCANEHRYCVIRFHNLESIVNRLLLHINPEHDINIYSNSFEDKFELIKSNNYKPQLTATHQYIISDFDNLYKIQGTKVLQNRCHITPHYIKECYYTSIYVILFLLRLPVYIWSGRVIDLAIENGINLFKINSSIGGNRLFEQREINNILIDGFLFNIFVYETKITSDINRLNLLENIKYYFMKRQFLIIQFSNVCFVIHKDCKYGQYHLFDCYSCVDVCNEGNGTLKVDVVKDVHMMEERQTASWILFPDIENLVKYTEQRATNDEIFTSKYLLILFLVTSKLINYCYDIGL